MYVNTSCDLWCTRMEITGVEMREDAEELTLLTSPALATVKKYSL